MKSSKSEIGKAIVRLCLQQISPLRTGQTGVREKITTGVTAVKQMKAIMTITMSTRVMPLTLTEKITQQDVILVVAADEEDTDERPVTTCTLRTSDN